MLSVSVQLLDSLFDLVFLGLGTNSEHQRMVLAVLQLTSIIAELELQDVKFCCRQGS